MLPKDVAAPLGVLRLLFKKYDAPPLGWTSFIGRAVLALAHNGVVFPSLNLSFLEDVVTPFGDVTTLQVGRLPRWGV